MVNAGVAVPCTERREENADFVRGRGGGGVEPYVSGLCYRCSGGTCCLCLQGQSELVHMTFKCSVVKVRLSKLAQVSILMTGIHVVPGLSLDRSYLWLTSVPPAKCQYSTLNFVTLLIPPSLPVLYSLSWSHWVWEILAALLSKLQLTAQKINK
jgi:hypothetical protein